MIKTLNKPEIERNCFIFFKAKHSNKSFTNLIPHHTKKHNMFSLLSPRLSQESELSPLPFNIVIELLHSVKGIRKITGAISRINKALVV